MPLVFQFSVPVDFVFIDKLGGAKRKSMHFTLYNISKTVRKKKSIEFVVTLVYLT